MPTGIVEHYMIFPYNHFYVVKTNFLGTTDTWDELDAPDGRKVEGDGAWFVAVEESVGRLCGLLVRR